MLVHFAASLVYSKYRVSVNNVWCNNSIKDNIKIQQPNVFKFLILFLHHTCLCTLLLLLSIQIASDNSLSRYYAHIAWFLWLCAWIHWIWFIISSVNSLSLESGNGVNAWNTRVEHCVMECV
eukprot:348070_1